MDKLKEIFSGFLTQASFLTQTDQNEKPLEKTDSPSLVPIYHEDRLYYSVPGSLRIHAEGDIELVSDKHVMLNSGQTPEKERSGYFYSVWFNTSRDQYGRPVQDVAPGKYNKWLAYKHRYRTQVLKNKLHNRRQSVGCGSGCGCK